MSQIGEIIAEPTTHSTENADCPFCPKEDPPADFETYPGEKNDSGSLGDIMDNPDLLVEKQKKARPKQGQPNQQAKTSLVQKRPKPIFKTNEDGDFSCEAHHLISGNQALGADGHQFEQWIDAGKGGTIEKDTGYSVNNADNGIWAPSIPEKFKNGTWGPMDFDEKYKIAKKVMDAGFPQFHKSHHAILDPHDPAQLEHKTYDGYLKGMLKQMNERMKGWSVQCPLCGEKGNKKPFQPSYRVNQILDNLSMVVRRKISHPATAWNIFLSKYALRYHNDGHCAPGAQEQ